MRGSSIRVNDSSGPNFMMRHGWACFWMLWGVKVFATHAPLIKGANGDHTCRSGEIFHGHPQKNKKKKNMTNVKVV